MDEFPEQRLKDKVILITGGASGIGRASAIRMAKEGASVIVNDIDQAKIDEVVNIIHGFGGEAIGYLADVTKKDQITAMVEAIHEKYGRIDVLFANAGIGDHIPFLRTKESFWDRIFTASRAGKDGQEELSAYSASKGALIQFKTAIAKELGPKRITVNAICPGTILTPMYGPDVKRETIAGIDGKVALPLKKGVLDPEDVASLVSFLASSDSDFITGQAINIGGGSIFH
ncbi:MAG: SDR family NAD(P)-dependent oxidoreductase [Candidatus Helarchaeota archaeon]